ncbi:MAG: chemotaxis protein CheD [Gemmatimonadetes bacterium]|nr:chemotaxis protein CheD [Gemmatimonadota bacterium]
MADFLVSAGRGGRMVTYALGSCLGITVWDPVVKVGGMMHVMLPSAALDQEKAAARPAMFVDTGLPLLFKTAYAHGARKERLVVKVAGGASSANAPGGDRFQIGKRNMVALRQLLWRNGVLIRGDDVGGVQISRTMTLDLDTGDVTVRTGGGLLSML